MSQKYKITFNFVWVTFKKKILLLLSTGVEDAVQLGNQRPLADMLASGLANHR